MKFNLPGAVILSLVSWCFAQNNGTATNNYIGSTPSQRLIINQSQAQQMINTAVSYAANISIPFNVAILDPSGLLVAFLRMDNAFWGGIDISQKAAKVVAIFNGAYTTEQTQAFAQPGLPLYGLEVTNDLLSLPGTGYPIFQSGHFIGAIATVGAFNHTIDSGLIFAAINSIGAQSHY